MATTIFTLFVLYTLACVMDGQDVKPKWKNWLGGKLESMANDLKPIKYCLPHSQLCPKCISPFEQAAYQRCEVEMQMLKSCLMLGEQELYEARMHEHLAEISGGMSFLPPYLTVSGMVDDAKRRCIASILKTIEEQGLIDVQVVDGHIGGIIVEGSLYVRKPKNFMEL